MRFLSKGFMASVDNKVAEQRARETEETTGLSSGVVPHVSEVTRRVSSLEGLSNGRKLDVRAHQRTYEGAYTRTAIGCLAFSIMIIKLFSKEFLPIGAIYTIYGFTVFCFGMYKSRSVEFYYNPVKNKEFFKSSGNSVMVLTGISIVCYLTLLSMILVM